MAVIATIATVAPWLALIALGGAVVAVLVDLAKHRNAGLEVRSERLDDE